MNDAVATLGRPVPFSRRLWQTLDRLLACTLTANAAATARVWAASAESTAHPALAPAMVLSFLTFIPSRLCEVWGRMVPFLAWHSAWHYVPNAIALAWILQTAAGGPGAGGAEAE